MFAMEFANYYAGIFRTGQTVSRPPEPVCCVSFVVQGLLHGVVSVKLSFGRFDPTSFSHLIKEAEQ